MYKGPSRDAAVRPEGRTRRSGSKSVETKVSMEIGKWILRAGVIALLTVCSVNAILAGRSDFVHSDFELFWRSTRNYLTLEPMYSATLNPLHPYKYPPWTTALFAPFALLPLGLAGPLFRLTLVGCLGVLFLRARRAHGELAASLPLIGFWGIWSANLLPGQPNLYWMGLCLLGGSTLPGSLRFFTVFSALTGKIFHALALFEIPRDLLQARTILLALALAATLALPAVLAHGGFAELARAYAEASQGGAGALSGGGYGLPTLVADFFGAPREDIRARLYALPFVLMLVWRVYRRISSLLLRDEDRFFALLALSVAVHPLAYSYTFALCYPFAALVLSYSLSGRARLILALPCLALLCGVAHLFPDHIGHWLEAHQIRSLSLLGLAISLKKSR